MDTPRIMGIETEYGITISNQKDFNPILASILLINSYESYRINRVNWDYEDESPAKDMRGISQGLEKEIEIRDETRLINLVLPNGSRFYVDHAHPEYSTPECSNPRDLVIHDKAGERILNLARLKAEQTLPANQKIFIYKNNSDSKGNSYGCHENYLFERRVPYSRLIKGLIPFLVTRQIFTGAGKIGVENGTRDVSYQISQRADFIETEIGLETMHNRPIINTRDEPHSDPDKYRRLHIILGDANMSEYTTYIKTGITSIILQMIEDDLLNIDLALDNPVHALKEISYDTTCKKPVNLKNSRKMSAVEIQLEFLEMAHRYFLDKSPDHITKDVLSKWEYVLCKLKTFPMELSKEIDWVIKKNLIEEYMSKNNIDWKNPRVFMINLQYHDVSPYKGLYNRIENTSSVERIVSEEEINKAIFEPPKDTRAYFRGKCLQKYPSEVVSASWDSIIFDIDEDPLKKIFMLDPYRGSEDVVGKLLEDSPAARDLLNNISSPSDGI